MAGYNITITSGAQGATGQGVPSGGTAGQFLTKIDGSDFNTQWTTSSATVADIGDITNVTITSAQNGEVLTFNGTAWVNSPASGGGTWGSITGTLSAQTDLQSALDGKAASAHTHVKANITDFSDGDYATAAQGVLAASATQPGDNISTLTNDSGFISDITAQNLESLLNVVVNANTSGEVLKWDGAAWVNNTLAEAGIAAAAHTHVMADITDSTWISNITGESLTDLSDVPSSLVGQAGKLVKVNPTEDGFIYGDPSGTTVSWGDIAGTLSNQTDLQSALDAKAATSHTHTLSDITDSGTMAAQDATSVAITGGTAELTSVQLLGGTGTQGTLSWNVDEETADLIQDGSVLQIGQEVQYNVRNNTVSTITNGTPVMATGTIGASGRITIAPMVGTTASNAKLFLGIATEDILAGADGKITHFGKVRGIQTDGVNYGETWLDGDILYISTTTAGYLTKTAPVSGMSMAVAFVIHAHATNGVIAVRVNGLDENKFADATHTHVKADITDFNDADYATAVHTHVMADITDATWISDITGESLNDLNDVNTGAIQADDILRWNSTGGYWQANSLPEVAVATLDLDDLRDVTVTTIAPGEILKWNGSAWINNTLAEADIAGAAHTHAAVDITSGTFADARIAASNVTQHQAALTITESQISDLGTYIPSSEKGAANGVATLDAGSKIPTTQLPALALTEINTVANEAAQLALVAQEGDIAIRTDLNKTYAHNGGVAGTMADWSELLTPTDAVLSVDGRTGAVTLSDLYAASSHTHTTSNITDLASYTGLDVRYYTETETDTLLSGKADTGHIHDAADVTTGTFADARISQSSVTQHQAALGITESQITDYDPASQPMARIAGSTYSTIQHMQDMFHSSGVTSWAGITDDADGTITVAAGTGLIRATDSDVVPILFMDWAAESGVNVNLTDNDLNYIYVEYNAGSPRAIATTTKRTDFNTNIFLGTVYRNGTTLHISDETQIKVNDHAALMVRRANATMPFARESGGTIGTTGTRNLTMSAGTFWIGLNQVSYPAFDTSAADRFTYYYRDGVGGWTSQVTQSQINNTQYDDGTGTLATLSVNQYGTHWVFLSSDGAIDIVFGRGSYTLANAQATSVPGDLPPHFEGHARLLGRIIIQLNAASVTQVDSVFQASFTAGAPSDHGSLTGLGDDDHTIYALADGTRGTFATTAQGALADSATQPGDNISTLTNDSGFIAGVAWGDVTGTLSAQTDLQTALDAKQGKTTSTVQTTDATTTVLATIPIPTDEEKIIRVRAHGHEDATNDHIWKTMTFGAKNIGGTASLVGGADSAVGYDAGASTWVITNSVSTSNVTITVTGEASHTINWRATVEVD